MRRMCMILLCFLTVFSLAMPAQAATGVSDSNFSAAVSANGNCQITFDLQIRVESANSDMTFPLPADARSITVNGNPARIRRGDNVLQVKLHSVVGNALGTFRVRLQYTLPDIVDYNEEEKLELILPMLSGFSYPVETMNFQISLPAAFSSQPLFSSGYHQQSIESSLTYQVLNNSISGTISSEMKDLETLHMHLLVTNDLFPHDPLTKWSTGIEEIVMIVLAVLAVLYWLLFLGCSPFLRRRCSNPPEGITAGELPCALLRSGMDLNMLVLSWAQMGYLLIQLKDGSRVILHKRMEMGNERDADEVRIFRALFGKRIIVDGSSYQYAHLYQKTASNLGNRKDLYKRSLGNPRLFQIVCAAMGICAGIALGRVIVGNAILGILFIAIMAVFGGVSGWLMQDWVQGWQLRHRMNLLLSFVLAAVWLLMGSSAGIFPTVCGFVASQLIGGLMVSYSGRRTAMGRQTAGEIAGLRHYLKHLSPEEAHRLCKRDPDYFFTMAPYAAAFGILTPFAKAFRKKQLSSCAYLTTGMDGHLTALEWSQIFKRVIQILDARQQRLLLERLLSK